MRIDRKKFIGHLKRRASYAREPYGDTMVSKLTDDDVLYDQPYGGKGIANIKAGFVYDAPYGGERIGRIDIHGYLYDQPYGGVRVGRVYNGYVYDLGYGGNRIGKVDRIGNAAYYIWK